MTVLILGGTTEATALAQQLDALDIPFTLSLAGTTRGARQHAHPTRVGGFGGVDGLAAYLANGITLLVDATHPFAAQMSRHAVEAASHTKTPLLRLERPQWQGAGWENVVDLDAAAAALPANARAFLSIGSRSLGPFLTRSDVWFLIRSIEPPDALPPRSTLILHRPPFSLSDELALLKTHDITHLVSKNAGGTATRAKIDAATRLHLPVIMVKRPQLPVAPIVETVQGVLKWMEQKGHL